MSITQEPPGPSGAKNGADLNGAVRPKPHKLRIVETAPEPEPEPEQQPAPPPMPVKVEEHEPLAAEARPGAHVIVVGNEKGGSGKSTTAMHLVVALMRLGNSVGAIDLDSRQRTLARYFENRKSFMERTGLDLPMPEFHVISPSDRDARPEAVLDETCRFEDVMRRLRQDHDFVVIDSPGACTTLSRLGHAVADTLITPMNDSFVDLDLLAEVDPETLALGKPGPYSEMVWEARKHRAMTGRHEALDWVVMRNRMVMFNANNKRRLVDALDTLSERIGFRTVPGFGERMIFRALFLHGVTLLDLTEPGMEMPLTMSHVAARQEVRALLSALNLPGIEKPEEALH